MMHSQFNRPFFLAMECVPGSSLLCNYNTQQYFALRPSATQHGGDERGTEAGAGAGAGAESGAESVIGAYSFAQRIGVIIALDIYLNNSDRIPTSVHDNEGNPNNLLLHPCRSVTGSPGAASRGEGEGGDDSSSGLGSIVGVDVFAIDTCVSTINATTHQQLRRMYKLRVTSYLEKVYSPDPTVVAKALLRTKEFIYSETCYEASPQDCLDIAHGIRRGVQSIVSALPPEVLAAEMSYLRALVQTDWNGVWAKSLALVDLEFLGEMHGIFSRFGAGVSAGNARSV